MWESYSKAYRERASDQVPVLFAYNDKNFVKFANTEEFVNWAVELDN